MKGTLRPRHYLKFPLVKASVKEIAYKSHKKPKSCWSCRKNLAMKNIFLPSSGVENVRNISHWAHSTKINLKKYILDLRVMSDKKIVWKTYIGIHFLIKSMKIGLIRLINTVLVYKKGSKAKNIFSFLKNMMSQLSNALSIVFISLKLVKLHQIKFLSVAPPKGHSAP